MFPEDDVNIQDTVTPEDVEGSSPEQQPQETQAGTAEQPETQEQEEQPVVEQQGEQRIPYNRFKEKVDEANFYKQQLQYVQQQQQQPPTVQQPTQRDELQALIDNAPDNDTKVFWQKVIQVAEKVSDKNVSKREEVYKKQINYLTGMITNIQAKDFRKTFPDVVPGSHDESEIAKRVQMGYPLEEAYWAVKGASGVKQAEVRAKKQVQQKVQQKRQANVEVSSVSTSSLPKPKESFRETAGKYIDKALRGELDED